MLEQTNLMKTNLIQHRLIELDGISIFYREAGNPNAPTILMLHGLPSSSHMYRNIIQGLADTYHIIAPDYPGFGFSDIPSKEAFEYSFDNITKVMEKLIVQLQLDEYYLLLQDYGGPIGMRIAKNDPNKVKGFIIQNANAYEEGIGVAAQQLGALMQPGKEEALDKAFRAFVSAEGIKAQYMFGVSNPEKIDPISYLSDIAFFEREGVVDVQKILFADYANNFPLYPEWQAYLKEYQPKTLVIWGANDQIFSKPGGEAYRKDLQEVEIYFFDSGHFMFEEYPEKSVAIIRDFLAKAHS